ncbi:MAG TPA: hypothetical protein VFE50_16890 [Cyclobacteriaceae bacterium]|nr:hypothetical protein [Cyclobacteriaceae bacterium]
MTSLYTVEDFRKKLFLLCDVKLPSIRFMRSPTSSSKPYIGEITEGSFELRKNSAVFATTFYIVGDYKSDGEKTQVYFGLKRSRFEYYVLRIMPIILVVVMSVALSNSMPIIKLIFINLLFISLFALIILLDNYFGKKMAQDFIEQLKISL